MYSFLQILSTMLVAVAFAMALAHALEFPGKRRLDHSTYVAVQRIYYPGFTVAGAFGDFGGLAASVVLLVFTPAGSRAFFLVLIAVLALVAMWVVYLVWTHPVNKVWLREESLSSAGSTFFGFGRAADDATWVELRDRWEYSHVARAVLAAVSLFALVLAR